MCIHAVCALYVGTLESRGTANLGSGDERMYPLGRVPTAFLEFRPGVDIEWTELRLQISEELS